MAVQDGDAPGDAADETRIGELGSPPVKFYESLGRLAYEFGHLDGSLTILFSVQLRPDHQSLASMVAAGETTEWLRNKCIRFLEKRGPFTVDEARDIRKQLETVKELIVKRNRFIHSEWYYEVTLDRMIGFQNRRHSDAIEFDASVEEILEAASRARCVSAEIDRILDRLTNPAAALAQLEAREAQDQRRGGVVIDQA